MALVIKISEGIKDRSSIHKITDCSFFVIENNGEKYLQLDTFGSDDRQITGKVSQSIQFSPAAIIELKKILNSRF